MSRTKNPAPTLAGYSFLEGIGSGGFADVFRFTQHSTGQPVAIKVLRTEHLTDDGLAAFRDEAQVMAVVSSHPNIVAIYDTGVAGAGDGRPYIVMEDYPEANFAERSVGGRLRVSEVLKTCILVCSAIETAHRAGILHRDIKPANILTSGFGQPALTDFGIAGVQGAEGMSALLGASYGFVAPELILDETATGSVASDVYAMTATTYALLAGRTPVHVPGGDNRASALVQRAVTGATVPVGRDDVPRSLVHLLAAGLAIDPDQRPASVEALALALQQVEQELALPHTPLVLRATGPAVPRPVDRTHDEEGTKQRRPLVVDVDGPPSSSVPPTARVSPTTPLAPGDARGRRAPITAVPDRRSDADADPATQQRRAHPVRGPGAPDRPLTTTVARSEAADALATGARPTPSSDGVVRPAEVAPRPRWLIAAAVGAALALLAVVGLVASQLGGGGEQAPPTTTTGSVDRQDPIGPASVDPPTDVSVQLTPATGGAAPDAVLSWTPPTGSDTADDVRYRVSRTDGVEPLTLVSKTGDAEVRLTAPELAPDGELCVEVFAIIGDTISEASAEACSQETG